MMILVVTLEERKVVDVFIVRYDATAAAAVVCLPLLLKNIKAF